MIKTYSIKKAKIIKKLLSKDIEKEQDNITKKRIKEINYNLNRCVFNIKNDLDKKNSIDYIDEIYTMYFK